MKKIISLKIKWLKWAISIVLALVFIYIVMHTLCDFSNQGQQEKLLNRDQLSAINSLIVNSTDSTTDATKNIIKKYLTKNFNIVDSKDNILTEIDKSELHQLQTILPTYPITVKSFFWLNDPWVLLEIVFWSLFGLIANLLFSVTSAAVFDPKRIPEHIGKFFYTPFLAIIIYLSLNALINSGSIILEGVGNSVIVLSFILGFYTRRSIVLLGRVKDLILPAKDREPKPDDKPIKSDDEQDVFKRLAEEDQKRVVNEFIKSEAHSLKKQFPEIQGFSAQRKIIGSQEQGYYCLHIDIETKKKHLDEKQRLPSEINFIDSNGDKYTIQTDIIGVGKNELEFSKTAKFIGINQTPKQLGLSCSRKGSKAMGTIGLKVFKNNDNTPYLLSCYHVLCSTELNANLSVFNNTSLNADLSIVSPGTIDCKEKPPEPIATVSEGMLNNHIDAALAKLNEDNLLENKFYDYNGRVNGIISLTSNDVKIKRKVYLFGRTSGRKKGVVIDNYHGIVYFDDYPKDTLKDGEMWNLILTSKISQKGDSGAAVVDSNNKIIGLLVGSNTKYSIVIPIRTIINKLNINEEKLRN